jgi:signal transduction histidine kinase
MTADIAYDLRTPLTVISGYLESLRDGVLKPTHERFDAMYKEAQHLQRLVEDLRTLSLADAGELSLQLEATPPRSLLERLAATFQHQAEQRQVTLQVEVEPELPAVNVDPERMAQVLGNLISNALRYTPEGGQITLSAQRQASAVALQVQDNGAGITPEALPHIFERFYRGDTARHDCGQSDDGESGLGLAIARSIVELHGGTITADSAPGKGTKIAIVLPA